jgi:RND superfamily putative drug exporter
LAFTRLANFIVKHYKLVIVLWIAVLFYIFPLIFKINDVVVYQDSSTGMDKLEALKAQKVIDENFKGAVPPSTIIVVIQNTSVLSTQVRDFTWSLYQKMTAGGLQGVQSVGYLYSTLEDYYVSVAVQAWQLLGQTNQTAQLVFGVPLEIAQGHMSALIQSNYTLPDSYIEAVVLDGIRSGLVGTGLDNATIDMTMGYAQQFYDVWLNWTPPRPMDDLNLTLAIHNASAAYFGGAVGGDLGAFAVTVSQGFTTLNYSASSAQQTFTEDVLVSELGARPSFFQLTWAIGHTPSTAEASDLAQTILFGSSFEDLPVKPDFVISQFVNTRPDSGSPNTTMLMVLSLSVDGSSSEAEHDVRALRQIVKDQLATASFGPDMHVYVSGDPASNVDMMDAVNRDVSKIDFVTVGLVLILVFLFFRSFVTPWVPLLTVGMAYLTSMALVYLLGRYVLQIHYSVLTVMLTVMLGAGTDYCIFIISRYREERILGRSKEEAVKTSLTWAGESIATSGATVMIGFGALMIGSYSLVKSMGMALVIAVGMALLFALTMLPSLLMLIGDRVFWPNTMEEESKRFMKKDKSGGGYFRKSARFSLKNRGTIVIIALIVALPAVYLVLNLESSYDFTAGMPNTDSTKGINAMGDGFGKGNIMPTYIVVTFGGRIFSNGTLSPSAAGEIESYCQLLLQQDNVRSVSGPTRPFGVPIDQSTLENLSRNDRATYAYVIDRAVGSDNRTVMLTLVLQDEPFTTKSIHTIDKIRKLDSATGGNAFSSTTEVLVGGATASTTDVSRSVSGDFFTMRVVAITGIYFVLMFVLGSLVIPLRLILTVLLTVVITIATTMIVFQYYGGIPVLWMLPLLLFVIALGLGMDYDIFLTTRIREEVAKGKTDEQAITTSVERTGGIITACGVIMAGAFGSMMLSSTSLLREFGFGLAFAILLDAMIVRIYLVPAIMLMLQKWNWYAPGRLQRTRRENKGAKPPRKH